MMLQSYLASSSSINIPCHQRLACFVSGRIRKWHSKVQGPIPNDGSHLGHTTAAATAIRDMESSSASSSSSSSAFVRSVSLPTNEKNERNQHTARWKIPPPTWSIREMMSTTVQTPPQTAATTNDTTNNHNGDPNKHVVSSSSSSPTQSTSQLPPLNVLAKRALIHLDEQNDPSTVKQIQTDLDQIWNWIQQVRLFLERLEEGPGKHGLATNSTSLNDISINFSKLSDREIYDVARGVEHGAPSRPSMAQQTEADRKSVCNESEQVWLSFLKHKTTLVGGHSYFVIPTATTKS